MKERLPRKLSWKAWIATGCLALCLPACATPCAPCMTTAAIPTEALAPCEIPEADRMATNGDLVRHAIRLRLALDLCAARHGALVRAISD